MPDLATHAIDRYSAPVREWLQNGTSALIWVPTGLGSTLTAFLSAIDRLMFEPVPPKAQRCRVLYISPLKALAVDVERNLRAPLAGVARTAERMAMCGQSTVSNRDISPTA